MSPEFRSIVCHMQDRAAFEDLARELAVLAERMERLEARAPTTQASATTDHALVQRLLDDVSGTPAGESTPGTVVYAGAGPWEDSTVAWQIDRAWPEVRAQADGAAADLFAALSNPSRIRIVCELASGSLTTGELAERLDQPSSGQLFHHLKELLSAGLIHQPARATYAIRRQHVVPLLAALSCAIDLAAPSVNAEPT